MKKQVLLLFFCFAIINSYSQSSSQATVGCNSSTSSADLDIGNVRAKVLINGDMWSDMNGTHAYEIPKGSGLHSLAAGALWIGGKDGGGALRVAAETYRQSGSDFWPGPLDTSTASITAQRCSDFDKHWVVTRQEVAQFVNGGIPSQAIIDWPGNGPAGASSYLAPFYDNNGDGIYDVSSGDYPKYVFGPQPVVSPGLYERLNGDQTIWWVFNDVGNTHMSTGSAAPIGIEIQAQAYAFCSLDSDVSNTTFYSYKIINRSSNTLHESILGAFVDPDLGNYVDDYVGCDVGRNMGYTYNGDNDDEGVTGYGLQLAAVGIDILDGIWADTSDFSDNNHDNDTDEVGEKIFMSGFLYYNNDATVIGNPNSATDHYNYLDGKWKDNTNMTYGGTGYNIGSTDSCTYMFPGDTDPLHYGTNGIAYGFNWSEEVPVPNNPGDRRFILSSGKFTMIPGSVYTFTKAAVWARTSGGISASVNALKIADDRIQSFFDSNFNNIATCLVNVGVDEINQIDFSIYPSPATDYFFVKLDKHSSSTEVNVYSVDGKLILKSSDFDNNKMEINTAKWNSGVYYLQIKDGSKSSTKKFTVIKK